MASTRGMEPDLRRTLALSRAFLRQLGPSKSLPAVSTADATAVFAAAVEAGLPLISHPIIPLVISHRLHAASQQAFRDSCQIAIEHRGLQSLEVLQARANQIRSSWVKIYTRRVEEVVSACSQKLKTQKQIADAVLDYAWQQETHPNFREIVKLARLTKRTVKQVTRWFENRRARYKNKPARGPSDMHEVLKNIAALKKPAAPADVYEDESKPRKYRDDLLPPFLRQRPVSRRPLVSHLAPQLWPRPYDLSTPARTDVLGPTVIPPSKTDPVQAPLEITKHAMEDLVLELSRLTLRQRIEPRPAKKGKKDPKLALITIEPAPKAPVVTDEPSSKPSRLYPRRRRALAKSKEAAAARQALASSSTHLPRSVSTGSNLPLGAPSAPSATAASSSTVIEPPSLAASSIDFNMLIAQLAADARAAQVTPSALNLPTPDDLSSFFGDLGSTVDFSAPQQVTLESLGESDPLLDQLFIGMPEVDASAVMSLIDNTSYDSTQEPFDLSHLLELNTGLDFTVFAPEPSVQETPVALCPATGLPESNAATDISLFAIEDPKEAAALQQVLQLLDDPAIMEELAEFTAEEQVEILTEFGMDLYKDKFRGKPHKGKGKPPVEAKGVDKPIAKSKVKPSTEVKGQSSTEANVNAPAKLATKAKRAKKLATPAKPSQNASADIPLLNDANGFDAQMTFDSSLLQAAANVEFSQSTWATPPAISAVTPAFSVDPVFEPGQLVDMPFDPAQFDPTLFAAMQFDPTLLAAASFGSTDIASFPPADTIQPHTSMPFDVPMPQFDFTQFAPAMQTPMPFDLTPQPTSFATTIDPQQTLIPDFTSLGPTPALYQQAPLLYQQAPLLYQQVPMSYQPTPLPYQLAPVLYQPAPAPYQSAPVSYQSAPVSYQPAPLSYQPAPPFSYQQPATFHFDQPYLNFDQQASFNFDYTAAVPMQEQPMPTFIPDLYNPFLTPDWFCAPMATMLQMPLAA